MDYKEGTASATFWHRFGRVLIQNPRGAAPSVTCFEERVMIIDGEETIKPQAQLTFPFNPAEAIPLLNPATNEPTGETISGAAIYQAIYSYVMLEAVKRDEAANA